MEEEKKRGSVDKGGSFPSPSTRSKKIISSPPLSFSLSLSLSLTGRVQDLPPCLAQLLSLEVELAADRVLRRPHVGVDEVRVEDLES